MFEGGMWIFYVEMLLVLALAGFIVWWTMPKKKPSDDASGDKPAPDGNQDTTPRQD